MHRRPAADLSGRGPIFAAMHAVRPRRTCALRMAAPPATLRLGAMATLAGPMAAAGSEAASVPVGSEWSATYEQFLHRCRAASAKPTDSFTLVPPMQHYARYAMLVQTPYLHLYLSHRRYRSNAAHPLGPPGVHTVHSNAALMAQCRQPPDWCGRWRRALCRAGALCSTASTCYTRANAQQRPPFFSCRASAITATRHTMRNR
eukprot:COSAG02_NODE_4341_length_5478_cov_14.459007_1_plen_203_part_00